MTKFLFGLLMLLLLPLASADEKDPIPAMLEQVLPAVVTVVVEKTEPGNAPYGFAGSSVEAYGRVLDLAGATSSGSGFLIRHEGQPYIVTNAHVIDSAAEQGGLFVYTLNQTKYPVRVVGGDTFYDLAVLAFTQDIPADDLRTLSFREDDIAVGERVFAIGNPLGDYPYSVSEGIIGGKNRFLDGLTGKFGYLQSTATTTWGNSGGPLVDATGRVAGINTRIEIKERDGHAFVQPQLNFALEAPLARRLVRDILTNGGRVRRAFLGMEIAQYVPNKSPQKAGKQALPVLVSVMPNSPAAAVLGDDQRGYSVIAVNGVKTRNVAEVLGVLELVAPGAAVTLTLENRRGQTQDFTLTSAELTTERLAAWAHYFLNRHGAAEATEHKGVLRVRMVLSEDAENAAGERRGSQQVSLFVHESGKLQKQYLEGINHAALETLVILAGAYPDSFWRIRSLADFGIAVRLAALGGFVDLIPWKGDSGLLQILQIELTGKPGVSAKTLFY